MRRIGPILVAIAFAGCSGKEPPKAPIEAAKERSYPMTGVVRKVDAARGEVTIRHEAIPGFMGRMTMTLPVADRSDLDDLHVGDEVEATLRIRGDRSELKGLAVSRPAWPQETDPPGRFASRVPKPLEPGSEVPDFAMTTQEGRAIRLSELRGKVVVLTFIYTRCPLPDFCPLIDRRFKELASKVAAVPGRADAVRLLSVSFDPEHDTPAVLASHAKLLGARPPLWTFAVAGHEELAKVAGGLGLIYLPDKAELSHNLSTSVIGPDGRLLERFAGRDWTTEDVLSRVRRGLSGAGGVVRQQHDIGER